MEGGYRRLFRVAVVATFVLVGYIIVFSDQGYLRQRGVQREIADLRREVESIRTQNVELQQQIDNLHGNRAYLEQLVRERLNYQRAGELPIRVITAGETGAER